MSAGIGDLWGCVVVVQAGDDVVEVGEDLLVHLGQPYLSAGLGGGDDLDDLLAYLGTLKK